MNKFPVLELLLTALAGVVASLAFHFGSSMDYATSLISAFSLGALTLYKTSLWSLDKDEDEPR